MTRPEIEKAIHNAIEELDRIVSVYVRHTGPLNGIEKNSIELIKQALQSPPSSEWMPPVPLPWDRKFDAFKIGDPVVVFLKQEVGNNIKEDFYTGEVKSGYRHNDGCVSYRLDGIGPQHKGFWGCGLSVPSVMLRNEYDYFLSNPDFYKWWRSAVGRAEYNGTRIWLPIELMPLPTPPKGE